MKNFSLTTACSVLVILGAINWGLVGLFNYNLFEVLFGQWYYFLRLVYILIGVSGILLLVQLAKGHSSARPL